MTTLKRRDLSRLLSLDEAIEKTACIFFFSLPERLLRAGIDGKQVRVMRPLHQLAYGRTNDQ